MRSLVDTFNKKPALATLRGAFEWPEIANITQSLVQHGFPAIEYTWNSPDAESVVERLNQDHGKEILVGAGTIVEAAQARAAIRAGAQFLVTPNWNPAVSDEARHAGVPLLPGVFTPTEVATANAAGWPVLKLFPGGTGGPSHLQALKGPFDSVEFVVSGGVSAENCSSYFAAGALAVAIGSSVFRPGRAGAQTAQDIVHLSEALNAVRGSS